MKSHPYSFPKSVRLHLKSDFERLFLTGKTLREHPFKVVYEVQPPGNEPLLTGVVVPRKLFKRP
jgi:RNase P protein component